MFIYNIQDCTVFEKLHKIIDSFVLLAIDVAEACYNFIAVFLMVFLGIYPCFILKIKLWGSVIV
jgi:hypothetical protein